MNATTPTATAASLPEYLTVEQLQDHFQIGRSLAYQLARKHGVKVGGRLLRVPRERIADLMQPTSAPTTTV